MTSPENSQSGRGSTTGLDLLKSSQGIDETDSINTPRKPARAPSGWLSAEKRDARPPQRTPRFIFGSSNPSGSGSTPRFAATPRFTLAAGKKQKQEESFGDEIHTSDAESQIITPDQPIHGGRLQKDEIPYSEDEGDASEGGSPPATLGDHLYPLSPGIYDIEDEYDLLFPTSPSRPAAKRRRLSPSPTRRLQGGHSAITVMDNITSSPGQEPSPPPGHSHPFADNELDDAIVSPPPRRILFTPLPGGTSTPFPPPSSRMPRLQFNPREPQSSAWVSLGHTAATTTPPNRPHFVLPLSPSRRNEVQSAAVPSPGTLFSPTSTRTGRPSRARQPTMPDYIPGGMAAQVRNWIFELNAARQASQQLSKRPPIPSVQAGHGRTGSTQRHPPQSLEKYYLVAQAGEIAMSLPSFSHPSAPSGCGAPVTLINATQLLPEKFSSYRKLLLFGAPGSSSPLMPDQADTPPRSVLYPGCWIGVRRGAVWDMEISKLDSLEPRDEDAGSSQETATEKWLVGAEWDILPAAG